MNILIFTNTFTPHVGGVARSVESFTNEYRKSGNRVLIVAPEFPGMPENEEDVIRIEAIQNFNASDFSVALPLHSPLTDTVSDFQPDIVHSQHPFLLGMTALRLARYLDLPLIFTHHTLYENYTHYLSTDSTAMERFVIELATRYANLTDHVFAPSGSVRNILQQRGVTKPISVVPTGIRLKKFASGNGRAMRQQLGIPEKDFVIGHLGRLAPEKNLEFLAQAVADFMRNRPKSHFLLIGTGPLQENIRNIFACTGVESRFHHLGILQKQELADALHAMDVFAFSSKSETQGLVLSEAMAAGLPVIALDAPGVREVVNDKKNGRLLQEHTPEAFSAALQWIASLNGQHMSDLKKAALDTAEEFSITRTAVKALNLYEKIKASPPACANDEKRDREDIFSWVEAEWEILKSFVGSCGVALSHAIFSEEE